MTQPWSAATGEKENHHHLYFFPFQVAAIAVVLVGAAVWSWWLDFVPAIITEPDESYDFVVVGAGTAGCVLAARLSEVPSVRVLLIEAGGTEPWLSSVPFLAPLLQMTDADWSYVTTSQKHAAWGFHNNTARWPRGKVLGGSSTINYLLHMRGHQSDYDEWASHGCEGWNYEHVLQYFLKSENYRTDNRVPSSLRGKEGPFHVSDAPCSRVCEAWLEACEQMNLSVTDINEGDKIGFMRSQVNILNGRRVNGATAYLWTPMFERKNLHILLHSQVTKIIFSNLTAVGVEYRTEANETRTVGARKEVIVCAGVIGSPQLLMLSGIGDEKHLRDKDIPVIANISGVGQNLQDHLNYPIYVHLEEPVSWNTDKMKKFSTLWDYIMSSSGLLSQTGVEVVGTFSLSKKSRPDLLFILFNMGSIDAEMYTTLTNIENKMFQEIFPDTQNTSKEGFVVLVSCLHPQSTGSVALLSSDPLLPPIINPNYLTHEDDVKCLAEGFALMERFVIHPALRKLGARIHLPNVPRCIQSSPPSLSDPNYVECLIRTAALTVYHPIGTCRMGPSSHESSVVSHHFQVVGVNRLRVVDASIFPSHISGTLNNPVTMIAEKAADLIRDYWNMH